MSIQIKNIIFFYLNNLYKQIYIVILQPENRGVAQSVARYVRDVEVAGSNLVTPTN